MKLKKNYLSYNKNICFLFSLRVIIDSVNNFTTEKAVKGKQSNFKNTIRLIVMTTINRTTNYKKERQILKHAVKGRRGRRLS